MWKDNLRYHHDVAIDYDTPFHHFGGNSMAFAGLQYYINTILTPNKRIGIGDFFNIDMTINTMTDALKKFNPAIDQPGRTNPNARQIGSTSALHTAPRSIIMTGSQSPPKEPGILDSMLRKK